MKMKEIFENKTILITGGTGYLGRALTREILKYNPYAVRVFSRDEVKHHKMQEEFNNDERLRNLIGDVRDYERLRIAMRGVDIVIHAAALKRLDILEYNVQESIKTNIIGTLNVVNAALEMDVKKVILISTDKACSPVNTYGACKFVSERIFIESNYNKGNKKTILTCVRYGNVLESTGSVIPFFESKIVKSEDIPLTDKRMTRFIISPKDAVELIFDSIRYSIGGEIFVPILPAFKIVDLIEILKEKHSYKKDVKNIGIRPGEKIHELMINSSEIPRTFRFKNMYVITPSIERYKSLREKAEYYNENKLLKEEDLEEYSSKDALITKDQVKKLFKELGLI
jgi:UDP-N-acetylglucosamine 4,6-dehydratase/5-epimerase